MHCRNPEPKDYQFVAQKICERFPNLKDKITGIKYSNLQEAATATLRSRISHAHRNRKCKKTKEKSIVLIINALTLTSPYRNISSGFTVEFSKPKAYCH